MKKNIKKYFLFTIVISILIFFKFSIINYANNTYEAPKPPGTITMNSVISAGDTFIERGKEGKKADGNNIYTFRGGYFRKSIKAIFRFIYTIGIALSVIISAILGIKIIIASPEEKAEIKERLIPYIIGCIVAFSAFSLWSIVMKFAAQV